MKIFVPPIKSLGNIEYDRWVEPFIGTGGKESNRNAVYEVLLSSIELKNSISNAEMKTRIMLNEPQLTGKEKK